MNSRRIELTFKDLEIKNEGYYETIVYGTESYVWTVLRNGGIAGPAIEDLFKNASYPGPQRSSPARPTI